MKKFGKIAAVLAALALVLVAFTSCDPTFGLTQLAVGDVSTSWINGTWTGSYVHAEWEENGTLKSETVTKDQRLDCSTMAGQAGTYVVFAAAAATGNLYANKNYTKVVYYEKTYWDNDETKLKSQYIYTYYKDR